MRALFNRMRGGFKEKDAGSDTRSFKDKAQPPLPPTASSSSLAPTPSSSAHRELPPITTSNDDLAFAIDDGDHHHHGSGNNNIFGVPASMLTTTTTTVPIQTPYSPAAGYSSRQSLHLEREREREREPAASTPTPAPAPAATRRTSQQHLAPPPAQARRSSVNNSSSSNNNNNSTNTPPPERPARSQPVQISAGAPPQQQQQQQDATLVSKKVAFISPAPTTASIVSPTDTAAPAPVNGNNQRVRSPAPSTNARDAPFRVGGYTPGASTSTANNPTSGNASNNASAGMGSGSGAQGPARTQANQFAASNAYLSEAASMRSGTPMSYMSGRTGIQAAASWSEAAEEDLVSNLGQRERTRQEVLWEIVASEDRFVAPL